MCQILYHLHYKETEKEWAKKRLCWNGVAPSRDFLAIPQIQSKSWNTWNVALDFAFYS